MPANIGLAGAISGISQGLNQGLMNSYNIRKDTQKMAQQQQLFDRQMTSYDKQDTEKDLQIQQMQLQLKDLQNKQTKQDTYDAFSGYRASGDTKFLNQAIKNNPKLKDLSGVARFDSVHPEADKNLLETSGITEHQYGADPNRYVKITTPDGDIKITDMNAAYAVTGYLNTLKKEELDDLTLRSKKAQTTLNELKVGDAEQWLKDNPTKTYTDYLTKAQATKSASVKDMDFLNWKKLPGNSNKTYSEYNNLGKTSSTRMTSANLKDEYANLRVLDSEGKLDKPESVRLKVLHELFSTDNDEKRDILKTGMGIVDKYYGEGNLFNQDISKEDIINTKLYAQQAGIKPDSKPNQDLKDQFITLKIGKRLDKEVSELKDDEISRGIIDTGIQKVSKLLGDETFKKLSDADKAKALKSIEMKTKLGKFLAKYINGISGTAVAEQEYNRLSELFSGSNLENTEALKQGVKTFVRELDKEFRNTAKTSLLDNPSTTLDLVSKYKKLGFKEPEQIKEPEQQSNNGPKVGDIMDGYKFLGGNPADQNSWEQVQGG